MDVANSPYKPQYQIPLQEKISLAPNLHLMVIDAIVPGNKVPIYMAEASPPHPTILKQRKDMKIPTACQIQTYEPTGEHFTSKPH